ncbi:MAG: hypothetical protein HQL28_06000 [Candidatus Omnitrophica bacterium]|nr:hypothetical protein [Candidatus Omnitrophota bacterium]
MKKACCIIFSVFFMVVELSLSSAFASPPADQSNLAYQVDISMQVTQLIGDLFQNFSDGYVEADEALEKLNLYEHDYGREMFPPAKELKKLDELIKKLFSAIENYFIFYKEHGRENPEIDMKIVNIRNEIAVEASNFQYLRLR